MKKNQQVGSTNGSVRLQTTARTVKIPQRLLTEIAKALAHIQGWGSVEIFIQDYKITQITERNIKKTDGMFYASDDMKS